MGILKEVSGHADLFVKMIDVLHQLAAFGGLQNAPNFSIMAAYPDAMRLVMLVRLLERIQQVTIDANHFAFDITGDESGTTGASRPRRILENEIR